MSPSYAINVSGIAATSTQTKLDQFFSFCGRIQSITLTPGADGTQNAVIVFEKESAAKTALLLNDGTLDGAHLSVTSESISNASSVSGEEPISQEDKPKSAIIAEYLAHGYVLSDQIVQRAIETDQKQGISARFIHFITDLDKKAGEKTLGPERTISGKIHEVVDPLVAQVVGQAKAVDQQRGITKQTGDYYSKALATPAGQKILDFYTSTKKEILDVHTEAARIAAEKKAAAGPASPVTSAAPTTSTSAAAATPGSGAAFGSVEGSAPASVVSGPPGGVSIGPQ